MKRAERELLHRIQQLMSDVELDYSNEPWLSKGVDTLLRACLQLAVASIKVEQAIKKESRWISPSLLEVRDDD